MKKVYDWNIKLLIRVENISKTIQIVCSVHTNIHQLKIQISKKLNLLIFDTDIDIYGNSRHGPMKPTSTLLQNGIQKSMALTAVVSRVKENRKLDIQGTKKQPKNQDKESQMQKFGLSILCSCTNQSCVNFGQNIWINYGFGTFPILQIISHTKCQVCPYRTQYLRPNMLCKEIKVNKSVYKFQGRELNNVGISIDKQTSFLKCIKQKDIKNGLELYQWMGDLKLIVKHI